MPRLSLLVLACALAAGCSDRSDPAPDPAALPPSAEPAVDGADGSAVSFTVRGLYLGAVYDSAAAVISHEAVPGFMDAMRMQLRVAEPAELRGLRAGDKIRFRLADNGSGYRVHDLEALPPDTPLELADFGADAVPPEASVDGGVE